MLSVCAQMDTVALPLTGEFWLTVRMLAPTAANAESKPDSTPGLSWRVSSTVTKEEAVLPKYTATASLYL